MATERPLWLARIGVIAAAVVVVLAATITVVLVDSAGDPPVRDRAGTADSRGGPVAQDPDPDPELDPDLDDAWDRLEPADRRAQAERAVAAALADPRSRAAAERRLSAARADFFADPDDRARYLELERALAETPQ